MRARWLALAVAALSVVLPAAAAFVANADRQRRFRAVSSETPAVVSAFSDSPVDSSTDIPRLPTTSRLAQSPSIEGLVEDYDRLERIDDTVRALQQELPRTLRRPLTGVTAARIYSSDFRLVVAVGRADDTEIETSPSDDGTAETPADRSDDVVLCRSRSELINLSELLVLGTTATQQASSVFFATAGRSRSATRQSGTSADSGAPSSPSKVACQLILDESFQKIRVPWKTTASPFGSTIIAGQRATVQVEGLSEFEFDRDGKIKTHRILKAVWNGNEVNGPVIGQAIRGLQTTIDQLQQSPLLSLLPGGSQISANIVKDIRDGLMEQAMANADRQERDSAAVSADKPNSQSLPPVVVLAANDMKQVGRNGLFVSPDIVRQQHRHASNTSSPSVSPVPGTPSMEMYRRIRNTLVVFCNDIIPVLCGDVSFTDGRSLITFFDQNATLLSADGTTLLRGGDRLVNYYESLALARKGTVGRFAIQSVRVDWQRRTVSVSYTSTIDTIPSWIISGVDEYQLRTTDESEDNDDNTGTVPIIEQVQQLELSIRAMNGTVVLNEKLVMQNLIATLERGRSIRGSSMLLRSDLLSDILKQTKGIGRSTVAMSADKKPVKTSKLSVEAAANMYYIMSELHRDLQNALDVPNSTSIMDLRVQSPLASYIDSSIELKGYLGETLVRGSTMYEQSVGGILTQLRRSIARGDILVDSTASNGVGKTESNDRRTTQRSVPPNSRSKVELRPDGSTIRATFQLDLKIPPLLRSQTMRLSPNINALGFPLRLELISDYCVDIDTGKIVRHKIVESRVNGQPTPADAFVQMLKSARSNGSGSGEVLGSDATKKIVSDILTWVQDLSSGGGSSTMTK